MRNIGRGYLQEVTESYSYRNVEPRVSPPRRSRKAVLQFHFRQVRGYFTLETPWQVKPSGSQLAEPRAELS